MSKRRYKGEPGKAWEAVKRGCRRRDKDCYTCPRKNLVESGMKADAGHYRPVAIVGKYNTRAWDTRFIHLQCSTCNGQGQGEQVKYRAHLVLDYGEEVVAEFDRLVDAKQVSPVKDWNAVIETWNALS